MKTKLKIKKGDVVKITTGNSKGQEGKILSVLIDKNKAIVEGVNMVSKHTKPNATHPQGAIEKKEMPVHISNMILIDPKSGKPTKVGRRIEGDKLVRYAKVSNTIIK